MLLSWLYCILFCGIGIIKTWLPELKDIPTSVIHDETKLRQALSKKGRFADVNYPQPMVEHKQARLYAIEQFKG